MKPTLHTLAARTALPAALALTALALTAHPAQATTSVVVNPQFGLGPVGNFALFDLGVGSGSNFQLSGSTINGDILLNKPSIQSASGAVNGTIYESNGTDETIHNQTYSTGATDLSSYATNASTNLDKLATTSSQTTITGGTISSNANLNVYDISSLALTSDLTISTMNANSVFIFNVASNFTDNNDETITVTGTNVGNVIFNFYNGSSFTATDDNPLLDGIYLDPAPMFTPGATVNGELIGGSIKFNSGATLNGPSISLHPFTAVTPEPSQNAMLALLACVLGGLLLRARRKTAVAVAA